jgi:hypothetical protein
VCVINFEGPRTPRVKKNERAGAKQRFSFDGTTKYLFEKPKSKVGSYKLIILLLAKLLVS